MSKRIVHRCRQHMYTPCAVHCIAVCSCDEKKTVAVSRSDGSIEVWSTRPTWFQKHVIYGHKGKSVESLVWVENRLVSASLQGEITEYDLSLGTEKSMVDSYGGSVWCLSYCSQLDKLAAGCEDGSVKIFSTTNKSIDFERSFDRQEGRILCMAWHESGKMIVTASSDIIRIWNAKSGHASHRITLEREMKSVETIVWSLLFLKDYTIVSGDSYGRVQFWNGKTTTLLQSFRSHRADVLTMCKSSDEQSIFASGVDPRVFEFRLVRNRENTRSWVKGRGLQKHTHDVRAMVTVDDLIISGGVDTNLMVNSIKQDVNKFQRIFPFPPKCLASSSTSAGLALFEYPDSLELWKMAKTGNDATNSEKVEGKQIIPIEENPVKLVQIKIPASDLNQIQTSVISPCGRWLLYSTVSTLRIYRLHFNSEKLTIKLQRVRCENALPSRMLSFSADSTRLVSTAANQHSIQIMTLDQESIHARILQCFPTKNHTSLTHLVSMSPDGFYVAAANLQGEIDVYCAADASHHCSLPRYGQIPTAVAFHPIDNELMVAYDDLQVFEYNVSERSYTEWTRKAHLSTDLTILYSLRKRRAEQHSNIGVVTRIIHDVNASLSQRGRKNVMFVSREGLYVVERPCESKKTAVSKKTEQSRFCHKFAPILHADVASDGSMLVLERPLTEMSDLLPPTLYQKAFGT